MNAIEVAGLEVRRAGAEVLSDLAFTVTAGSYLAVVGPNGSGKTTLLRALLGLERPSAGTIRLLGQPQDRFHDWRRIGYLPQVGGERQQALPATVAELVATGLIAGKPFPKRLTRADLERVDEVLDGLGIHDLRHRLIGRLSGGQQQRVLLARALVCRPELLLLDEPTLALDPQSRDDFYRSIDERHRVSGVTVVLVTHDTGSVGAFASHMLYLDRRLVFHGTFTEFCRSAAMAEHFGRHAQHVICHQHCAADGEPCGTC